MPNSIKEERKQQTAHHMCFAKFLFFPIFTKATWMEKRREGKKIGMKGSEFDETNFFFTFPFRNLSPY